VAAPLDRRPEFVCVECQRTPTEGENPTDEWRVFSDGISLHVFCPECAKREFGKASPVCLRWRRWGQRLPAKLLGGS